MCYVFVPYCVLCIPAFCYSSRKSENQNDGCHAKEGNPFESFWDTYNVDFDSSQFFGPLYYATDNAHEMKRWVEM